MYYFLACDERRHHAKFQTAKSCAGFADGGLADAAFHHPHGVAFVPLRGRTLAGVGSAEFFVMDESGNRVRHVDLQAETVTTIAGTGARGVRNGPADSASFSAPAELAVGLDSSIFVADWGSNRIRQIYHYR